jgi:hypothetical protein
LTSRGIQRERPDGFTPPFGKLNQRLRVPSKNASQADGDGVPDLTRYRLHAPPPPVVQPERLERSRLAKRDRAVFFRMQETATSRRGATRGNGRCWLVPPHPPVDASGPGGLQPLMAVELKVRW